MVESALLPDITRVKPDKSSSPRSAAGPAEPGAFEKVQADLSEANRKPGRADQARPENQRPDKAGPEDVAAKKEKATTDAEEPAAKRPGEPAAKSSAKPAAKAVAAEEKLPVESPDEVEAIDGVLALFMPAAQPVTSGNALPSVAAPAVAGSAGSAREFFLQMAQGGAAVKPGEGAAANTMTAIDPQAFKATLAEAADGKLAQSLETPGISLTTGARGAEIREGSAVIRQYSTTVDTPVQQGDWGDKMAGKISWLASQRISLAEIHVNPADLGPVDVRVSVQNDQASVSVHAANPTVRDLLELHGNRLRDMMQENGMNLARMDVSDQPAGQQRQAQGESDDGGQQSRSGADGDTLGELSGDAVNTGELHVQWRSQVDTYA
ncbi:flagellar hook-length control protein FliK [Hydrocarboniclastica marina]|uniref:Flagellar hook-length control protein FliK n=1 Tax=Hydrocarboniclastica marina TaxID=2259620 RepID=A0A4P7XFF9_9ALTE|nr:flagellar hook-length control protein FliK [Hydrocarboniclastica marina]QCF25678.1 flagellar hook-length control protein FliK [Hydrocarboniclastica marina]